MTPKFKIGERVIFGDRQGEIVGIRNRYDKDLYAYLYLNKDEISYRILFGNKITEVLERALEKIEETPKTELTYKKGDRVIFICDIHTNEQIEGKITNVVNELYIIENEHHSGYLFSVEEKYIIGHTPLEEFKEDDEVWVKGKVSWGFPAHGDKISVKLPNIDQYQWFDICDVIKSLPPKNEWIRTIFERPKDKQKVLCFQYLGAKVPSINIAIYNEGLGSFLGEKKGIFYCVTHWKPLDEPPSE